MGTAGVHCTAGHLAVVEHLLRHPGVRTSVRDSLEQTALHTACYRGHAAAASLLLDHPGVDCQAKDKDSKTPLMVAMESPSPLEREKVACVRVMVEKLMQLPGQGALDIGRIENYSPASEALRAVLKAQRGKKDEEEKKKLEKNRTKEDTISKMGTGKGRNARRRRKQVNEVNEEENGKEIKPFKPADETFSKEDKTLLIKALETKEMEAAEITTLDNYSFKQQLKELSVLSMTKKEFEAIETLHKEALLDFDIQMRELERKKSKTLDDQKKNLESREKVVIEHLNLEQNIEEAKKANDEKAEKLKEDIEKLKEKLSYIGSKTEEMLPKPGQESSSVTVDRRLEEFMERQVVALEEELECPVCLEVLTTSPIYKCADDHLICPGCRPKVKICPQCREKYPPGPFKRFR